MYADSDAVRLLGWGENHSLFRMDNTQFFYSPAPRGTIITFR